MTSTTSRRLGLALAGLAFVLAACADVGGSSTSEDEFPVVKSTDERVVVCQSIRRAMQIDKKAAAAAEAAGDKAAAAVRNQSVLAGAEGAKSVPGCDVSDLVRGVTAATPSPG